MSTQSRRRKDPLVWDQQDAELLLRLLDSTSGYAVITLAPTGRIRSWNRAAERLFGYAAGEAIGQLIDILFTDEDRAAGRPRQELIEAAATDHAEDTRWHQRRDGTRVRVRGTATALRDAAGVLMGYGKILQDAGERACDEQLRHTQKLESIGVLAGGIAHDFNNLLTSILGNIHLALGVLPPEAARTAEPMLCDAIHAGERAADLTRQLLAYAGKGTLQLGPVDLCALIREMTQLFRSTMARLIELRLELAPECGVIQGDHVQLKQLVLALVSNAAEAIGSRTGVITLRVRVEEVAEGVLWTDFVEPPLTPGRYVQLEVEDTGIGMSADTRARIFDPFFTTKFLGRGLGLSAALGIVRAHRGGLRVESEPGRGSRITVLVPSARRRSVS